MDNLGMTGQAGALPLGIIETPEPLTRHDYIMVDPMDMKAADTLLFQTVMHKREMMDPDGVLYIIIGEDHQNPAHVMLGTGLAENVALAYERNDKSPSLRPVFAAEFSINELAEVAVINYDLPINENVSAGLPDHDPLGRVFALAVLAHNGYNAAPQSLNHLLQTVLHNNMPLCLVDAKKDEEGYYAGLPSSPDQEKETTEGRNAIMATQTQQAAERHDAKIVVATTGLDHMGNKEEGRTFETSYPARLAEKIGKKDQILTVFCASANEEWADKYLPEDIIPPGRHPQITQLILRNMASPYFDTDGDYSLQEEKECIAALGESYSKNERPLRFKTPHHPGEGQMKRTLREMITQCKM